jgi:cyanophycinase
MPSKVAPGTQRGYIIPIGGAEEKEHSREILARFVSLSGGQSSGVVESALLRAGDAIERLAQSFFDRLLAVYSAL